MVHIGNDWDELLKGEFDKEYYLKLRKFLVQEYTTQTIYPNMYDIFNALKYTSFANVKAVILGQDPYHGRGQAHGLCFSVKKGVRVPPSLMNIYKEIQADLGLPPPHHGELTEWTRQGVLMLNTVLTVRQGNPNSHQNKGWEIFTNRVISLLNNHPEPIVFLLWGSNARSKKSLITNPNHKILEAAHPSPYSAANGFFGCRHFSKANEFLVSVGREPINWKIEE